MWFRIISGHAKRYLLGWPSQYQIRVSSSLLLPFVLLPVLMAPHPNHCSELLGSSLFLQSLCFITKLYAQRLRQHKSGQVDLCPSGPPYHRQNKCYALASYVSANHILNLPPLSPSSATFPWSMLKHKTKKNQPKKPPNHCQNLRGNGSFLNLGLVHALVSTWKSLPRLSCLLSLYSSFQARLKCHPPI